MEDHIKITNTPPRVQYIGDGMQREFFYPFAIFEPANIEVYIGGTRLTHGITVVGAGESAGGSVLLDEAPDNGVLVTVRRHIAVERTTDFQSGGAFSARLINDELDYLTAALQQVAADLDASLRRSATEPLVDMTLPNATTRANRILGFDDHGRPRAESKSDIAATIRHGAVSDLGNDDHPQYLTSYRADAWLAGHSLDDLREGITVRRYTSADKNKLAALPAGAAANPPRVSEHEKLAGSEVEARTFSPRDIVDVAVHHVGGASDGTGTSDHGLLSGLNGDDHPQYLTGARADTWLAGKTADDVAAGASNRYMALAGTGSAQSAARADHDHDERYEPLIAKKSAFNRDFGTTAGDVAAGNHAHSATAITSGVIDLARLPLLAGDAGSGGASGCAPAPAPGDAAAGKFLAADGTWRAPAATGGIAAGVVFPPDPQAGDVFLRTDLGGLFFYDGGRGKWLGELESDGAGYNNDQPAGYLKRYNGAAMSASVGIFIPYDVTIVGLSMAWVGSRSGAVQVRRNGTVAVDVAFSSTSAVADMDLNADLAAGGILAFTTSNHTGLSMPQLRCWWRRLAA